MIVNDAYTPFGLIPSQVPAFPEQGHWVDELRWAVAVVDHEDKDLGFVASLLSHAHKYGELTDKQVKYARRSVDRIKEAWAAGRLDCQQEPQALRLVASTGDRT